VRAFAWLVIFAAASTSACGGSAPNEHVATSTPAWEPPDTFDDLPRAPGAKPAADSSGATPSDDPAAQASAAPTPPATVSMHAHGFPLGTKIQTGLEVAFETLFTAEGPNGPITVEDYGNVVDDHLLEILGVAQGAARKLRVTFGERSTTRIMNGRQTRSNAPVSGKTYVLEARAEGLAIVDDKGRDVSSREGELLARLFHGLGTPEQLPRAIPRSPMPVGQPVPGLADAIKSDFERGLDGRVFFGKVSVVPTGRRALSGVDCAVFALVFQVGFEVERRKVRLDTKGELLLRAEDAWPVALDLAGPIAMDETQNGHAIHGEGKSRLRERFSYP
jgi:hypothetical protein